MMFVQCGVVLIFLLQSPRLSHGASDPMRDQDKTCSDVHYCMRKTSSFLTKYYKHLDRERKFDKCREFDRLLGECTAVLKECTAVSENIKSIVRLVECTCFSRPDTEETSTCKSNVACMEAEVTGFFSTVCKDYYSWEIAQEDTNLYCHTLNQYFHCREGLVRSACGEEVGNLLHEAQTARTLKDQSGCDILPFKHHKDLFQYSSDCPEDFILKVDECLDDLQDGLLKFYETNSILATGDPAGVRKSCRAFQSYMDKVNVYNTTCPLGIQQMFKRNKDLRTYIIKMEVICADDVYASNLLCLQEIHNNNLWKDCPSESILKALETVTPVSYYCLPDQDQNVQSFKEILSEVQECFQLKSRQQCNEQSAYIISALIGKIFSDPWYLGFGYETDCSLHRLGKLDQEDQGDVITKTSDSSRPKQRDKPVTHSSQDRDSSQTKADTLHVFSKASSVPLFTYVLEIISFTLLLHIW